MLLAEQQADVLNNADSACRVDIGVRRAMVADSVFQVYLTIVDEGHGQASILRVPDARGFHGIDWMPHGAKVREAGAQAFDTCAVRFLSNRAKGSSCGRR